MLKISVLPVYAVENSIQSLNEYGFNVQHVLSVMPQEECIPQLSYGWPKISDNITHTIIPIEDITEEISLINGKVLKPATQEDIRKILAVGKDMIENNPNGTLVIHCHQGSSRSVAAAYLIRALEFGPGREAEAFHQVFKDSRTEPHEGLNPNMHIVALGDQFLNRNGKLTEQVERNRVSYEGIDINSLF